MSEREPWQTRLREALAALALPADEQVRVNGPGCVACDLLNDFDLARLVTLDNASALTDEQRRLLGRIDAVMVAMQPPDHECFNDEVVRRPAWQHLRELAAETMRALGWENGTVRPFTEVRPGVWQQRPSA